ncbi:hypothetical protein [Aquibacillus sediminis]|uniref:hypothetical protein n=1 Tax=Aquibacillus sediminis TaxID=2574734 RepID=UPI001108369B|nr:hypothetical protein [Aquibacillus sediminis]
MTYEEAVEILETIHEVYPNFTISERKVRILIPQLKQMDYQGVLAKLSTYVGQNPFAPTLADIAVYPPKENHYLHQMKNLRKQTRRVPEETKRNFQLQMQQLIKEVSKHERD